MGLTKVQRDFLSRCERDTHADSSGRGAVPLDGHEIRTAESLAAKKMVTRPIVWGVFQGAKITPAGRAALKEQAR